MNSLVRLQSLGFLSSSANGLPELRHRTAKVFRDSSEISVIECHKRSSVTIAGRFQNHLIIRIGLGSAMVIIKVGLREFRDLPESDTLVGVNKRGETVSVYVLTRRKRLEGSRAFRTIKLHRNCDEVLAAELTGIRRRDKGEPR